VRKTRQRKRKGRYVKEEVRKSRQRKGMKSRHRKERV
jgi:hypothetical protein